MLFLRFVPFIPAYEVKALAAELREESRGRLVEEAGLMRARAGRGVRRRGRPVRGRARGRDAGYVEARRVHAAARRRSSRTILATAAPAPQLGRRSRSGWGWRVLAFALQWFCNAWSYPLNVGGRPAFAIPAFIPITFESGVLFASFASFFGVFSSAACRACTTRCSRCEGFERASHDRYFVGRRRAGSAVRRRSRRAPTWLLRRAVAVSSSRDGRRS